MPFEAILKAVVEVESKNGIYLFNPKENAVGYFGIRPIKLKDYCEKTGKRITLEQCYDYEMGKEIFLFYASQFSPDNIKGICINWNGRSRHNKYYLRIQKILLDRNR